MARIAIDAMGGDYAPKAIVEGALWAAQEYGVGLELVGREDEINAELDRIRKVGFISSDCGTSGHNRKIKIDVDKNKLHGVDLSALSRLVRISFAMRRKMLTNNLMSGYGLSREKAIDVLLKADISPTVRGEALSLDQYVKVLNVLKDFGTK